MKRTKPLIGAASLHKKHSISLSWENIWLNIESQKIVAQSNYGSKVWVQTLSRHLPDTFPTPYLSETSQLPVSHLPATFLTSSKYYQDTFLTPFTHFPYTFQTLSRRYQDTIQTPSIHLQTSPDIFQTPPNTLQTPSEVFFHKFWVTHWVGGWWAGGLQVHNHATSWPNLQDCKISSRAEIPKLDRVWQWSNNNVTPIKHLHPS